MLIVYTKGNRKCRRKICVYNWNQKLRVSPSILLGEAELASPQVYPNVLPYVRCSEEDEHMSVDSTSE